MLSPTTCGKQILSSHKIFLLGRRFAVVHGSQHRSNNWWQHASYSLAFSSCRRIEHFLANGCNIIDQKNNTDNNQSCHVGLPKNPMMMTMMRFHPTTTTVQPLLSFRSFSATTSRGEASSPGEDDDSHHPTLRQRLREGARHGAQRGQVMAKKGASTVSSMIRQYGPVFVGTYACIYFSTLGILFLGVDSGLLDPANLLHLLQGSTSADTEGGGATPKSTVHMVVEILEHYSFTEPLAPVVEKNPHVANLAVAWIAIKFTEPVRFAVTLAIVPRLARYFGFVVKKTEDQHDDDDDDDDAAATAPGTSRSPTAEHVSVEEVTTRTSLSTSATSPSQADSSGKVTQDASSNSTQQPTIDENRKVQQVSR